MTTAGTLRQPAAEPAPAPAPAARTPVTGVTTMAVAVVFALVALVLVWRIVVVNLSAMFGLEAETNPAAAASAVAWDGQNGDALLREAAAIADRDPVRAQELARRALAANPASARAYLVLARLAADAKDEKTYAQMLVRAAELEPQNGPTRLALAELAVRQQNVGVALHNLDAAIRARPQSAPDLYAQILQLLNTPDGEAQLRKVFARGVPAWWPGFFAYAAAQADSVVTPLRLLDLRRAVDPTPTAQERQPVVARLVKEGHWQTAFLVWINGLTLEQRRAAGNVYNGSFESPFTNTTFDWRWPQRNGVEVEALPTFGTTGVRALRLAFQGQVTQPQLVAQTLLLDPGYAYELRGRYRLESVRTQFGIQWEVSCGAGGSQQVLGSGERLVGTSDWREFAVKFNVPAGCYPQQLALALRGDAKLDLQATGLAYFDDLQVVRGAELVAGKNDGSNTLARSATGADEARRKDGRK
ncbi:MAG: hypothetical protein U1F10_02365 [Burkholderiales bacterium]